MLIHLEVSSDLSQRWAFARLVAFNFFSSSSLSAHQRGDVSTADSASEDGQWVRAAKDFASTRFSSLDQLTAENIKQLKLAWSFSTGTDRGHEAASLVVGTTMYIDPAGSQAAHIAALWWWMFWIFSAIFLLVVAALVISISQARVRGAVMPAAEGAPQSARKRRIGWMVAGCVGLTVVLVIFLAANVITGHKLALLAADNAVTIQLTGYKWWWKVQYPDPIPGRYVTTANQIHIPVGRPVLINTDSQDVIHSFWVPSLHVKRDLVPDNPSAILMPETSASKNFKRVIVRRL
jgi:heme/copper-type cytochrome/quinol oxidase subunit 2